MSDDYLASLTYQIKEEVISNYLRERLILEEEKKEFSEELSALREIEETARRMRDQLACLLVTPENLGRFFTLIGVDRQPLSWLSPGEAADQAPACPVGLTPKGFTDKGRYLDLVLKSYDRLRLAVEKGREQGEKLEALADEVNNDIRTFQQRHDITSIINFLKSLDVDLLVKKKFMGGNFSSAEIGSIATTMNIEPVKVDMARADSWPELPSLKKAKQLAANFVSELFRAEREAIRPALH